MKKLLSTFSVVFKSVIVILTITAVVFGGANSAQRLFDAHGNTDKSEKELTESAQLLPGPPEPEEMPGNMDAGKPNSEPTAYINSGLNVITIKLKDEINSINNYSLSRSILILENKSNTDFPASFAQVSIKLAEQFTLVGSKPDGTS
jgi:hypothetical protein